MTDLPLHEFKPFHLLAKSEVGILRLPWDADSHADLIVAGPSIGTVMILNGDALYRWAGYWVYFFAVKP